MKKKKEKLAHKYRVDDSKGFKLKDFDPSDTDGWDSKDDAAKELQQGVDRTAELQDMLYAQDKWALLLIFQAMDAAGKDGAIKHVMSGVNPQGCQVYSFKAPSTEELNELRDQLVNAFEQRAFDMALSWLESNKKVAAAEEGRYHEDSSGANISSVQKSID